ncbi:MAG: pyruvate formate lyase family protein [Acetanaerobacterium sp.]
MDNRNTEPLWGTFETVRPQLEKQFDDVPFDPESGYSAEELGEVVEQYLETHKDTPRVTQKAVICHTIITKGRIAVEPHDMFADKLLHDNIPRRLWRRWYDEVESSILPFESAWTYSSRSMGNTMTDLDLGHLSPGWPFIFANGIPGILQKSKEARKAQGAGITQEQTEFYDSVELVYSGVLQLMQRYIDKAESIKTDYPQQRERLELVAQNLRTLCEGPPKTLHQALQLMYIIHQIVEMEGQNVRSMGGFDRNLYSFYKADIDAGRLTRDQAKELIKFFWIKFYANTRGSENGKNFYFAGQLGDGSDAVNELSYVAMEVYAELKTPDPKLSVRFTKDTPEEYMHLIAKTIRDGQSAFVLSNDEVCIPAMVKRGKTLEDARNHLLIGCYEPAVEGKEIGCHFSILTSFAKDIEFVLNNGVDPLTGIPLGLRTGDPRRMNTFKEFFASYIKQLDHQIRCTIECVKSLELNWPLINPSPFLAGTIENCLKVGKDICQGGAVYNNTGITGAFLANAADSLLAVKTLVYDEKRLTMDELINIVNGDYEGQEQLRQYILNKIPKFGNNSQEVDDLALRITEHFTDQVNGVPNNRGGSFQASMYTVEYNWLYGKLTGALPDGRKSRAALAPTLNPMLGMDKGSVTDMINSITKLNFVEIPNGSVVTVTLHPSVVSGEDGLQAMISIIKTFFKQGGFALQFNIFSTETLVDAQKHPEKYPTLQVRVTGWSVYFVTMDEYTQNIYIDTYKHKV